MNKKGNKNINEYVQDISPSFISRTYDSMDGNIIFQVCSASEFDDIELLKENILGTYIGFMEENAEQLAKWCKCNQKLFHNHTVAFDPIRVFVDQMTAYGTIRNWLKYRQVYKFSRQLMDALEETEIKAFNFEYMANLPYPSLFIDTRDAEEYYGGAFIYINDNNVFKNSTNHNIVMILIDRDLSEIMGIVYIDIPNEEQMSIKEVMDSSYLKSVKGPGRDIIAKLLNCLIYLNIQTTDIDDGGKIVTKRSTINKKGKRIKYTSEHQVWNVGYRSSSYFKQSNSESDINNDTDVHYSKKRPHLRCGHWHKHWAGSKDNKHIIVKWHAPTFVNCNSVDKLPTVEHKVEK